jgi:hypothetical protein
MTTTFFEQGGSDEQRHAYLHGDGRDRTDPAAVNQLLSQFDFGNLLASLDAIDLGGAEGGDEVDAVPDQEADEVACGGDQELAVAALSGIPNAGAPAKRAKGNKGLSTFTEEDFEDGAERLAFRVLKANVDCLFDRKRKPEDHIMAAHWIFGRVAGDFNFENCCIALGTRQDVLRLRIHYEFWRLWYVFPIPFPFLIAPVPDAVDGEIFNYGGDEGYQLARAAWLQPGIRSAELLATVTAAMEPKGSVEAFHEKLRGVLKALSERYLMSNFNDSWYLTGKNPILKGLDLQSSTYKLTRHQLSWSKLF